MKYVFLVREYICKKKKKKKKKNRTAPFKCMTFNHAHPETRTLATGNFQGELQVWDLERLDAPIYNTLAHKVSNIRFFFFF